MKHIKLMAWMFIVPALLFMVTACASTNKAKQSAMISQQMYDSASNTVVQQITEIVKAADAGTITSTQKKTLADLSEFKKVLNKYAEAHNAYVTALKIAETSSAKNNDVGKQARDLAALSSQIIDYCNKLGITLL